MALEICFVLSRLGPSGGERVALDHAQLLARAHGHRVTIALAEQAPPPDWTGPVELAALEDVRERRFDVAVATWWRTALALFELRAHRRAYFIQNLEERLYRPGDVERLGALVTQALPVAIVTEAAWLAQLLEQLQPGRDCRHVPNGVDKTLFAVPDRPPARTGPLRILIEGSSALWFKGVDDALAAVAAMREPRHVSFVGPDPPADERRVLDRVLGPQPYDTMPAVYDDADVLLKLSRVEGVFTPPLEAFHRGATCVVWPVTGHDEVVEHDRNGLVADWDDVPATARWLDLLAADRGLLAELQRGALETARDWPSVEHSAALMDAALSEIAAGPEPDAAAAAAQLLADVDLAMEEQRLAQLRLQRRADDAEWRLAGERAHGAALQERIWELEGKLSRGLAGHARRLLAGLRR
jgi:glycosyltransferase involved in cell wall biosynthesis